MAKNPKPHEMRNRKTRKQMGVENSRYAPTAILPNRHLFVTEGTKTEPLYLASMIETMADNVKQQFTIYGGGDNTLNLLKKAEELSATDETRNFQHIWVIYDKDSFPNYNFDNTVSRCDALTAKYQGRGVNRTFHAVWSNECFEVWLLFHYMFLSAGVPRSQYAGMLETYLEHPYEKNDPPSFEELREHLEDAIRNAKKQNQNPSSVPPSGRNPCTNFYELIETLRPYL